MDSRYAPPTAPSPPTAPTPRYAYLVARLRNRQITMDEATELFEIQQNTLARAMAQAQTPEPAPEPSSTEGAPPSGTGSATPSAGAPVDDVFWMGLIAAGAGAGLIAAVLKRAQEGPKANPAPATPSRSSRT